MKKTSEITFDGLRPPCPWMDDSHSLWRDSVRNFVDREIMPYVEEWESAGRIPRDLYPKAAKAGLLGMNYPEALGGVDDDTDAFHAIITSEELSRVGAGGIAAALMIHGIGLPPVMKLGSKMMQEEIVPQVISGERQISLGITEPSGGSDVAKLKTKAVRDGNGWRINGSKTFITGGMTSRWMTTAVRTGADGMAGISLMLVDLESEGVSRTELPKMGWWSSDTATIHFDDVFVPADALIGQENQGFYGIMANFNSERLGMAAQATAYARACIEDAATWAQERQTFGKRLADHQVIRHKMASMARKSVRERFAETLLMLKENFSVEHEGRIRLDIALTREELGAMVGAAAENITRLMTEYKDLGYLSQEGKSIYLLDTDAIESEANIGF